MSSQKAIESLCYNPSEKVLNQATMTHSEQVIRFHWKDKCIERYARAAVKVYSKLERLEIFIKRNVRPVVASVRRNHEAEKLFDVLMQLIDQLDEVATSYSIISYYGDYDATLNDYIRDHIKAINYLIDEIDITHCFFKNLMERHNNQEYIRTPYYESFLLNLQFLKYKLKLDPMAYNVVRIKDYEKYTFKALTHPLAFADCMYVKPTRFRQEQKESCSTTKSQITSNFLVKHLMFDKRPRLILGNRVWERKNTIKIKSNNGHVTILPKSILQEENLFDIVRKCKLESETIPSTQSMVILVRDYFINNTKYGNLLQAAAWTHISAALVQIILHITQYFMGGSLWISITGLALSVCTALLSFAELSAMGKLGVELPYFEKIMDAKIRSYFSNVFQTEELESKDLEIRNLTEKLDKLLKDESNDPKIKFTKSTQTNTDVQSFKHSVLPIDDDLIKIPNQMTEEFQNIKIPNYFIPLIHKTPIDDNKQLYYEYSYTKDSPTSSYDNNCFWHALSNTKNYQGQYQMNPQYINDNITVDKLQQHFTKDEINLFYTSLQLEEEREDKAQAVIEYLQQSGMKEIDFYTIPARLLDLDILVIINPRDEPRVNYYPSGNTNSEFAFISFENAHFSKVVIETIRATRNSPSAFRQNLLKHLKSLKWMSETFENVTYNKPLQDLLKFKRKHIINCYNTLIAQGVNLQGIEIKNLSKEKIVQYAVTSGVSILSVAIGLWGMFTDPKYDSNGVGKNILEFISVSRATKKSFTDAYEGIAELMSDLFGVSISPSTINKNLIADLVEETQKHLDISNQVYLNDHHTLYLAKTFVINTHKKLHGLNEPQNKTSTGYNNTILYLRGLLTKLQNRLDEITKNINNFLTRQETLAVRLFGAAGAGKTEYVTRKLIPELAKLMNVSSQTASIHFHQNAFWPILRGEKFAVYDEFLAQRDKDPIIKDFNNIHAAGQCPLDAAEVEFKAQPCPFWVMFYMSNTPYENLKGLLNAEAEVGFYGRFASDIQFVNVKQRSSMTRNEIPRGEFEDTEHYELRQYLKVATAERNTIENYYSPTKDANSHLLKNSATYLNPFTNEECTIDVYDNYVYGEGNNRYKLLTHAQLMRDILLRINEFKQKFNKTMDTLIDDLYTNEISKDNDLKLDTFVELLKTKGYCQEVIDAWTSKHAELQAIDELDGNGDELLSDKADHFVINVAGQGGSGKSYSSTKISKSLGQLLGMPVVHIRDITPENTKLIIKPSIIVLHDSIYDEVKYLNFYDTIPKPSILFVTHNLPLSRKKYSRKFLFKSNNPDIADEFKTAGSRMRRTFGKLLNFALVEGKIEVWEIQSPDKIHINGFARRLGLPGFHYHGGICSRRPLANSFMLQTNIGYKLYERELTWPEHTYTPITITQCVMKIYKQYNEYISKIVFPKMEEVDSATFKEKKAKLGDDVDVVVEAPTVENLIALTNDMVDLLKVFSGIKKFAKEGHRIKVSSRVSSCPLHFDATEFTIRKNAQRDEGVTIAQEMYRLLMHGNAEFTANIECDAFKVLCAGGKIYYTDVEMPSIDEYTYTIKDNNVVFTHRISNPNNNSNVNCTVVYQDDIKTFVENVFNGFNPDLLEHLTDNQKLNFVNYVNELMSEEPFAAQHRILDMKRSVTLENISEKFKFLQYWEMFKSTKIFKIIKFLFFVACGATLTFIVGVIISSLYGLFNGKKKTKVRIDDKTVVDCDYWYKVERNIDDNFDTITARFWIDLMDFDYGETSWATFKKRFKETVHDYIIPNDQKLKGVTNVEIENISLHSSKEMKFHKVEKKDYASATQMQGKSSLYDGNKKEKNVTRNPKFRSATNLESNSLPLNQDIMTKIQGNIMDVRLEYTHCSRRMHGLNIGDGIVLTMYHLICEEDYENNELKPQNNWIKITGTYKFDTDKTRWTLKPIIEDKARDLLVFQVVDKTHAPKPHIVKYFREDNDKILPCVEFRTYNKIKNQHVINIHRGTTKPVQLAFDIMNLEKGTTTYITEVLTTHDIVSQEGDCGLPLYSCLATNNRPILGLHYGSSLGYIQAVQITQEYLRDQILPQIPKLQAVEEEEIFHLASEELNEVEDFYYECETIQYEGPDGETETVIIDKPVYDLMLNLNTDESMGFDCLDEGEHTLWFGYTPSGNRSHRLKPKYVQTPYSKEISKIIPVQEVNAVTDNRKVEDPSNLVQDRFGNPSIMMSQQNKLNDPVNAEGEALGKKFMRSAKELLTSYYIQVYGQHKHRLLTDLEVINGLYINPREPFYGNLEPIAMDGAPGANLTMKFNISKKKDLFKKVDIATASGRDMYWWNDTPASKYCQAQQAVQDSMWPLNVRCESIVQSNLKCELRPIEKVRVGKTRVFESFTTSTSNNTRKYLGTIFAAIKMHRSDMFNQIGIDTTDFHQIWQRFKKIGDYGEAGDFSAWDKHLLQDAMEMVPDIWTEVFFAQADEKRKVNKELYKNVITQIIRSNYKAIIIADGHVFTKNRGNCSGSQTTTPLNGIVNELYRIAIILYLITSHNTLLRTRSVQVVREYYLELYKGHPTLIKEIKCSKNLHEEIVISSMSDILKYTDFINYGDDLCSVINAKYLWLLNFVQYQKAYKYLFGIDYDSPAKDGTVTPFTKITELSFISRTLHLDSKLNVITPRLKMSSINRLLHWTTEVTFDQLTTNLNEIFDELVMYDKNTWDQFTKITVDIINPYLKQNFGQTYLIPNYNMKRENFEHQVRYRTKKSSFIAEQARNDKLTEKELINILSKLVLEGASVSQSSLILPSTSNKTNVTMAQKPFQSLASDIASEFNTMVDHLPDHLKLKISGSPALLIDKMGREIWSISTTGPLHNNLDEYEKEVKRVLSTRNVNLQFIDVHIALVMAPGPSHRIQFKMRPKTGCKFLRIDNTRVLFSNLKLEASSSAAVDPVPQVTPGVPVPIQDSGVPVTLSAMGYSQVNTLMKAYTYTPLMNINIPVGSTYGKVIANLQRTDLINKFMINAKTGDNEYMGSFRVKVVNQVNPGLTGTLIVGMTKEHLETPTENDLLVKQYYHLDGNTSHNIELTISPFAEQFIPTRFKWPVLPNDDIYYPSLVILVKTDYVSTFDNPKLYSQVQLYTAFHHDFISFYNGQISEKNVTGSKKMRSPGESIALSQILGENVRLFTDGAIYGQNTIDKQIERPNLIINDSYYKQMRELVSSDGAEHKFESNNNITWGFYIAQDTHKVVGRTNNIVTKFTLDTTTIPGKLTEWKVETSISKEIKLKTTNTTLPKTYSRFRCKPVNAFVYGVNYKYDNKSHYMVELKFKDERNEVQTESLLLTQTPSSAHKFDAHKIIVKDMELVLGSDGNLYYLDATIVMPDDVFDLQYVANFINFGLWVQGEISNPGWEMKTELQLNLVETLDYNIEFPLEFDTIYLAVSATFENETSVPNGCSALQCVNLPLVVPPPSEGAVSGASPTVMPTLNLAEQLSRFFDSTQIYQLAVTTRTYNQTLFTFIYHGPENCCFINTRKIQYLVSTELSQDLSVMLISTIPVGSQLPVTTYDATILLNREIESKSLQAAANRKFVKISPYKRVISSKLEAALAGAMIGGSLLSGLGQGLAAWGNNQMQINANRELQAANHANKLELQQNLLQFYGGSLQEQMQHQLKLSEQNHMLSYQSQSQLMEQQLAQQKDFALFNHQLNGYTSPAMMRQTAQTQKFESAGFEYPGTQNSTLLETPIEQFDLRTGARITQQEPLNGMLDFTQFTHNAPKEVKTARLMKNDHDLSQTQIDNILSEEREASPIPTPSSYDAVPAGLEEMVDTTGDEQTPQKAGAAQQPATSNGKTNKPKPKNLIANSHKLGAEPGTKLKDLKFPDFNPTYQ